MPKKPYFLYGMLTSPLISLSNNSLKVKVWVRLRGWVWIRLRATAMMEFFHIFQQGSTNCQSTGSTLASTTTADLNIVSQVHQFFKIFNKRNILIKWL